MACSFGRLQPREGLIPRSFFSFAFAAKYPERFARKYLQKYPEPYARLRGHACLLLNLNLYLNLDLHLNPDLNLNLNLFLTLFDLRYGWLWAVSWLALSP